MDIFTLVSALNLAAIYGLVAVGISLVWSSLGVLNLAHGFTFAAAGYGAFWAGQNISDDPFTVLLGGILVGALVSSAIGGIAFVPIQNKPNYSLRALTATLAISLAGTPFLQAVFGPQSKPLPPVFTFAGWEVGGTVIEAQKIGTIGSATVLSIGVLLWIRASRRGLQIRALMQNSEGAALVGVSVQATSIAIMAVTGALVGLASVLLAQTFFVSPSAGVQPLIKGLIVSLLGGLGSVGGAVAAAILIGFAEALTTKHLGGQYVLMVQFGLIFAVLAVRPRGIAGLLDETRE